MSESFAEQHRDAQQRMALLMRYYQWTFSLIESHLGQRVLDVGCGIGNFTQLLAGRCRDVVAVDGDEQSIQALTYLLSDHSNVRALTADLPTVELVQLTGGRFDSIVSLDFLEHVEDDAALLRSFCDIAARDTRLILKVPSSPGLFGGIDVASGHYRRYSMDSLRDVLSRGGWTPLHLKYMNFCGVFPYWLQCALRKKQTNFSRTFSRSTLRLINAGIPVLRLIDRLLGPPLGLSIVAVASRQSSIPSAAPTAHPPR